MSYQVKCFIFLNLFDMYMKPTMIATQYFPLVISPLTNLVNTFSRNHIFSKFFKHVWHAPKMAPVFLLLSPPSLPPPHAPEPTKQVTRTGIY